MVPTLIVLILNQTLDNDSWYVLAQGRSIAENGIYYQDTLSMHSELPVIVQNYAFSVVFYWIYSVIGAPGIFGAMLILNLLIIWLIYKICMVLSNKKDTLSLIIAAVTDSLLAFGFIVTRAQMIDYVVILALIYILELFIKNGKTKNLWWIPLMSIFMANFHASTWWMIFAIMGAYGVEMLTRPERKKYKWDVMIAVFVIALVVGAINPYGIQMVTAIFGGYQEMAKLNFVNELLTFNPLSGYNLVYYVGLIAAIILYIYGKNKLLLRHLLLFIGFLTMGLASVKGFSEVILVMLFPLAFIYKDWKMPKIFDVEKIGRGVFAWTGVYVAAALLPVLVVVMNGINAYPSPEMKDVMDMIDEKTADLNKEDLKIYSGYNQGGYVEYRGYHAYLDPRGEYFVKSVDGEKSVLDEWMDLRSGKIEMSDFISKYEFDFMVVDVNDDIRTDKIGERYKLVYGDEDAPVQLFERI